MLQESDEAGRPPSDGPHDSGLPEGARRALERAAEARLSFSVRVLQAADGRLVAVLGEAHMKLAKAAAIGKDVVEQFELRGVETFQRKQVIGGRALGALIAGPRTLLRVLSLGAVRGSTITDAKELPSGYTVELERTKRVPLGLHVAAIYMAVFFAVTFLAPLTPVLARIAPPVAAAITLLSALFRAHLYALLPGILLRDQPWSWVIHPFLGILSLRDVLMAEGTVRMLEDHPTIEAAVVVMGRAHVPGYTRLLVEHHGFTLLPAFTP
jgi:hypothetical protein